MVAACPLTDAPATSTWWVVAARTPSVEPDATVRTRPILSTPPMLSPSSSLVAVDVTLLPSSELTLSVTTRAADTTPGALKLVRATVAVLDLPSTTACMGPTDLSSRPPPAALARATTGSFRLATTSGGNGVPMTLARLPAFPTRGPGHRTLAGACPDGPAASWASAFGAR